MNNTDGKEYTKLPVRHKTLSTHVYILYISQELIDTFFIINNHLKSCGLSSFKNKESLPELQRKNITLSSKELSSLQGKPNTVILNSLTDITLIT